MTDYPIYEIRRRNLARLLTESGAKVALAVKLDLTAAQISHWLRQPGERGARTIKEDAARRIENVMGLPLGALDKEPSPASKRAIVTPPAPEAKPRNGSPVNHDLMAKTIRTVLLEVQNVKGKPMIDKVAEIATLAYERATDHGELDESYVHTLVKLMT